MSSSSTNKFFVFLLVLTSSANACCQIEQGRETSLTFLGYKSGKVVSTGEQVKVAAFCFTNREKNSVSYATVHGVPDLLIRPKNGKLFWNWCGMGKRTGTLKPGESVHFYINPECYVCEHGNLLKIGILMDKNSDGQASPKIVWSADLNLPNVDNPDVLPIKWLFTPKAEEKAE